MRDLIAFVPFFISQLPSLDGGTGERLTIGAIGIGTTVYLFKLMQAKDEKRQAKAEAEEAAFRAQVLADAKIEKEERKKREEEQNAERNRLLALNNELNEKCVEVLIESQKQLLQQGRDFKIAVEDGQRSIKELIRTYNLPCNRKVEVMNSQDHPIPTSSVD